MKKQNMAADSRSISASTLQNLSRQLPLTVPIPIPIPIPVTSLVGGGFACDGLDIPGNDCLKIAALQLCT
jgi:hypothetical protein